MTAAGRYCWTGSSLAAGPRSATWPGTWPSTAAACRRPRRPRSRPDRARWKLAASKPRPGGNGSWPCACWARWCCSAGRRRSAATTRSWHGGRTRQSEPSRCSASGRCSANEPDARCLPIVRGVAGRRPRPDVPGSGPRACCRGRTGVQASGPGPGRGDPRGWCGRARGWRRTGGRGRPGACHAGALPGRAAARWPRTRLRLLPFRDRSFGLALAAFCLGHLPDVPACLAQVRASATRWR